jgi:hypothetical protein
MTGVLRLLSRRGEPTRAERRAIIVVAAVAIAAIGVLMLNSPRGSGALMVLAMALLLAVPLYALQEFRRNVFKRKNADERERQRRDEAYRLSYRVIEFALPLGFLVVAWSPDLPAGDWIGVWLAAFSYVIFLPYMFFAWREPDSVD